MKLSVVPISPDALSSLRTYARLETDWCRGLAEPVEFPGATVFASAEFVASSDSNSVANAWLPVDVSWAELWSAVTGHASGVNPLRWWINPSMPSERTGPVIDGLLAAGYRPAVEPLLRWAGFNPDSRPDDELIIVPGRAAFRAVAELASRREDATAVAHLDDPQVEAWVALSAGRAVGTVTLQVSGESAALRGWFVEPGFRRRGIGRALLSRASDLARRAGVTTVLVVGHGPDLGKAGFARVGDWTFYVR